MAKTLEKMLKEKNWCEICKHYGQKCPGDAEKGAFCPQFEKK